MEESRRLRVWRRRAGDREYGGGEQEIREYGGGDQEIESMEEESRRLRVWRRAGDRE